MEGRLYFTESVSHLTGNAIMAFRAVENRLSSVLCSEGGDAMVRSRKGK